MVGKKMCVRNAGSTLVQRDAKLAAVPASAGKSQREEKRRKRYDSAMSFTQAKNSKYCEKFWPNGGGEKKAGSGPSPRDAQSAGSTQ